jgi:tetratricopeptide (TPR) repeat protein
MFTFSRTTCLKPKNSSTRRWRKTPPHFSPSSAWPAIKNGEEDEEFNALREVLKLDPLNSWAKEEYGNLKSQKTDEATAAARDAAAKGDATAAEESFLRALHYSPESVEIHLALAGLYLREDKISNALVHLKAAADGDPENVEALRMYAATLAEDRQYERSLDVYQRVLEIDGSHQEARKQVEVLKDKLGIIELPSRYNEIPLAAELTREDMAALLAVRLRDILTETPAQPPIIVDISASWASSLSSR